MTTQMLVSSDDLDTSKLRYLAEGIIPETGCGYVWGPPGSSKSLAFGLELGLAVSNGIPFFTRPTRRGVVVYALGEGLPGQGIRKQARLARQVRDDTIAVAQVARDHGDEAARALSAALPAYTGTGLKIMCEPFDVRLTPKGEISASMREAITLITAMDEPPSLIILDAAADFTAGHSLSSDSNATAFASGLKRLASETDAFCLVIAHPVKAGTAMLGSGRLVAAADLVIEVQPDAAAAPGAAATSTVSCRKQKDGSRFPDFGLITEHAIWTEPVIGDDGAETGETELVESATVRLLEAPGQAPGPVSRPAAPLPVLADPAGSERPRKRSGLRPQRPGLHSVPDLPAGPGAAPLAVLADAANARRALAAGVLAVPCPVCDRPASCGCDGKMEPRPLVLGRTLSGPLYAHEDRVLAAALAGAVDLDAVLAAVA